MRYPVAIEIGDTKHSYGVIVPDLQGCYSAGEDMDEALENAKEAITMHIDGLLDDNETVPMPSSIEKYRKNKEYKDFIWALVEIDPAILDDKVERINITLPKRVLTRLDARAKAAGESRSGYIAKLAVF